VGSFSAASNVTGVVTDVDAVTELLHRGGALACWDYASAAAHLPIDMNPVVIDASGTANPWVSQLRSFRVRTRPSATSCCETMRHCAGPPAVKLFGSLPPQHRVQV
jgi:hypothetical protein